MSNAIAGLQPQLIWKYFAEISRIPRGSKNETAISQYVFETAKRLGLKAKQDRLGNVVVKKPASPGKREARPICLQGHLDMVCEKNAATQHDFAKDPIEFVRQGDVIKANGTTLGGDNGIAVATNLAIMEDALLEHGPLELLFTVDEETSMSGANGLDPNTLKGRTLLNLDQEAEGVFTIGSAGGRPGPADTGSGGRSGCGGRGAAVRQPPAREGDDDADDEAGERSGGDVEREARAARRVGHTRLVEDARLLDALGAEDQALGLLVGLDERLLLRRGRLGDADIGSRDCGLLGG